MNRKEFLLVVRSAIAGAAKDDVNLLAAGLTYYIFLGLFPLLLLGLTMLSSLFGQQAAEHFVTNTVSQYIPGATDLLQPTVITAYENRGFFYLVGLFTLAFSASAAFGTLDKAINRAWNTEKVPSFIIARLFSFLIMVVFATVFGVLFVASAVISTAQSLTNSVLGEVPGSALFWNTVDLGASFAVVFLLFLFMYRFLPRIDVQFRDVWPAALLAAIAWVLVKKGFAIYLGSSFAHYDAVYGTLGAVVALLFWLYISSLIILYGAELGSETRNIRTRHAQVAAQMSSGSAIGTSHKNGSPWFSTK